ncbi:MAG: hypothetical protein PHY47_18325 [Lachnospiraceae bacterium]|nr:hypothetical protein [Lachnospiraceae bacterium]
MLPITINEKLMTASEVRNLDNQKCLVFIRGFDHIIDNKYDTFHHPYFKDSGD